MLFTRKIRINQIDLGTRSLLDIYDISGIENQLDRVDNENRIQLKGNAKFPSIHNLQYDQVNKELSIESRYKAKAYFIFIALFLGIGYLSLREEDTGKMLKLLLILLFAELFFLLVLIFGITSESKSLEREISLWAKREIKD